MTISPPAPVPAATAATKPRRFHWLVSRLLPVGLFFATGVVLLAVVGLAQRLGWIQGHAEPSTPAAAERGAIYTCPMHPQIRQPTPGRCPICGMVLVPASSGAANLDEFAVKIEPAQRRLANIQTAPVERGPLEATVQTVGSIAIDESRQATIAAYIDGRLERLFADYTGVEIKKGDHLTVIYSPQLYGSQVEYLEARKAIKSADGIPAIRQAQESLATNTRQRLREFGMTDEQLTELERSGKAESRLTIYAPQGGTVVEKLAVEGNYVKAGDPIYRIAELSTVWLMLRLFPEDATRIRFGQGVEATIQSIPGETLIGRVAFLDPTVDLKTRTVGIRVELLNEDRRLRPGDYATARIRLPIGTQGEIYDAHLADKWISPMHPQIVRDEPGSCPICGMDLVSTSRYGFAKEPIPHPESLYVPRPAVLLAGANSVVYVETKPGLFEIRPVKLGPILRDKIVILDGLKSGEQVATAGNFLIDSQMQLAGKPSLIDPSRAIAQQKQLQGPLVLNTAAIEVVAGPAGEQLDALFAAYLQVQQALASDKPPPPDAAQALHQLVSHLQQSEAIPESARTQAKEIEIHSAHLHHLDLAGARKVFKPISHAVLRLAAQVRSEGGQKPFTHFYCPMVPGGGGDWLQATDQLLNPYFGSEMLRCGEKVQSLPATSLPTSQPDAAVQPTDVVPKKPGN
jgi:Cu(I)/Ag(I) efflux system membrane fusion protein